jgi:hypothetical protein
MFRNAVCKKFAVVFLMTAWSWPGSVTNANRTTRTEELQTKPVKVDENLETLGAIINGNMLETGKPDTAGKYERYKYEAFHFDGCAISWRETHEVYEARRRTLLEVRDVTAPLQLIRLGSVETNKIGPSAHLVSFQTQKLKPGITAREHTVYEDGSENESNGISTGDGFYFSDGLVAQRAAKALVSIVRYCAKTKALAN